jgi:drug/metabolite transporter (DMT)-like permease
MQTASRDKPFWRSRWWMPAFSLFLGTLMLAAFAIGGSVTDGLFSFGVMAALAALIVLGGRSETIRGLSGPGRDERWAMIDIHATALAGIVVIIAIIGAWLWEIAHGDDGSPYGQLGAIGGLAYIAAVALLRWRS